MYLLDQLGIKEHHLPHAVSHCARILGCDAGSLLFKYLGVQVGTNMTLRRNWMTVVDRVHHRLSSWKEKTSSFGGD